MKAFPKIVITVVLLSLGLGTFLIAQANAFSLIPGLSDNRQVSQTPAGTITAEDINRTKSLKVGPETKNLIVFMPSPMLRNSEPLPKNVTIAAGTAVIFVNGQIDSVHGIALRDEKGNVIFSKSLLPYKNSTAIRFDNKGKFTFSDTKLTSYGRLMNGTINVIDSQSNKTLSSGLNAPTVGLLIVPANQKDFFDKSLKSGGYRIFDSYVFDIPATLSKFIVRGSSDSDEPKAVLYLYGYNADNHKIAIKGIESQLDKLRMKLNP